jgi:hypothetical protein
MLGEPQNEIDVVDLFGAYASTSTNYVSVFEEEFSGIFGPMGNFIIKKQVDDLSKDGSISVDQLPFIINKLTESVVGVVGPDAAKDLKKRLKRRCGLPV